MCAFVGEIGKIEEDLQIKLFRANNQKDAKYDILKFLHISDTELKNPKDCLFISNLETKGINKGFPLFQELCKKDQTFVCQGFRIEHNKAILDRLGFDENQKWIVSNPKNLFECCFDFNDRILQEEIKYFSKHNHKIVEKLQAIKHKNTLDSPVIRIGKNEGYLSLTMGLLIKDRNETLYNNVLGHATKNTSYTGNFPKTRRTVNFENGDVDTCGWIQLTILS